MKNKSTKNLLIKIALLILFFSFLFIFLQKIYEQNKSATLKNSNNTKQKIEIKQPLESNNPVTELTPSNLKTKFIAPIEQNSALFITKTEYIRSDGNIFRKINISSIDDSRKEFIHASISTIDGNPNPVQLFEEKLFYINVFGELESMNIYDGKRDILEISKINQRSNFENKIYEFNVSHGKIVYTKGYCAEDFYCDLEIYDLITKKTKTLINDVLKTVNISGPGGSYKYVFNPVTNTVSFRSGYGDGGFGRGSFDEYTVDLKTLFVEHSKKIVYNGQCDPKEKNFDICEEYQPKNESEAITSCRQDILKNKDYQYIGCIKSIQKQNAEHKKNTTKVKHLDREIVFTVEGYIERHNTSNNFLYRKPPFSISNFNILFASETLQQNKKFMTKNKFYISSRNRDLHSALYKAMSENKKARAYFFQNEKNEELSLLNIEIIQ